MENMNWSDLAFGYMKTDYNVRCYYRDGKWGELEVSSSEIINIHMAATCLHYGQESFEGLKAFKGKDGKIRVFRMDENGKRMQASSRGIKMAELPVEKFEEAIRKVVKLNERFVPPYESGAALYIRPLMIGLGAQVGVKPAPEYMFMVFVTPVGPYFKGGFKPSKVCIMREYDRAAPYGTGTIKVGGNYAASLVAGEIAHEKGYAAGVGPTAEGKPAFGPERTIGAGEYLTFLLRALGYRDSGSNPDFTWQTVLPRARELGVITPGEYTLLSSSTFLRAHVAYLSYFGLDATCKEGGTLLESLSASGALDGEQVKAIRSQVTVSRIA